MFSDNSFILKPTHKNILADSRHRTIADSDKPAPFLLFYLLLDMIRVFCPCYFSLLDKDQMTLEPQALSSASLLAIAMKQQSLSLRAAVRHTKGTERKRVRGESYCRKESRRTLKERERGRRNRAKRERSVVA